MPNYLDMIAGRPGGAMPLQQTLGNLPPQVAAALQQRAAMQRAAMAQQGGPVPMPPQRPVAPPQGMPPQGMVPPQRPMVPPQGIPMQQPGMARPMPVQAQGTPQFRPQGAQVARPMTNPVAPRGQQGVGSLLANYYGQPKPQ